MYIFLDESDDLGFDLNKKSTSRYFIITLLTCYEIKSLKNITNAVKQTLERKINHKAKILKQELKGTTTNLKVKEYFLKKINLYNNYKIYSIILEKENLLNKKYPFTSKEKHRLYNKLSYLIIRHVSFPQQSTFVNLIVDKCKKRNDIKEFNDYLKIHLESSLPINTVLTIDHEESNKNFGLQAVDLFSYGIFKKYETNDIEWYKLFESKIIFEKHVEI